MNPKETTKPLIKKRYLRSQQFKQLLVASAFITAALLLPNHLRDVKIALTGTGIGVLLFLRRFY